MLSAILVCGIYSLHAHIESQDKIVEIEPHAQTVCRSELVIEFSDIKLSSRLVRIFPQRPNIAAIDEQGTVELPKEVGTILDAEVEFEVTRLIDEVDAAVSSVIFSRTE